MQLIVSKISNPKSEIRNPKYIKNIIFDFGDVICDLDRKRTEEKFKEFGAPKSDRIGSPDEQDFQFQQIIERYEMGVITSKEFRKIIKDHYQVAPSDEAVNDAWNALLLDIPEPRIRLLEQIRKNYRIFMLTNTNEIHYLRYLENLRTHYGYHDFDSLFEKAYFSYRIGLKKPDIEIFRYVLDNSHLNPTETLFIDDTLMHVESAHSLGIQTHHLQIQEGEQIMDLFRPE